MPVSLEIRPSARAQGALVVGLVNNMPDAAVPATEAQFAGILGEASGDRSVRLRLASFPELERSAETRAHIARAYWPLEELLADPPDALIVTGTEPRAAHLTEEPFWQRSVELLGFARRHIVASVWSCLAAHAAVLSLDGIERRRFPQKLSGVYAHRIVGTHDLWRGVAAPFYTPHSRWNDVPPEPLRACGYTVLTQSPETGADAFLRQEESLLLFFQGHPEYESTTLLREYRRDVGRYLSGEGLQYPRLPEGYLSDKATERLRAFEREACATRSASLLPTFPFASVAATLVNRWRTGAVAVYRNWLDYVAAQRL